MGMALEVELKMRADAEALEALAVLPRLGSADLGPAQAVDELDQYLDTADEALAAARWACRLRTRQGRRWISLKGPAEHPAGDAVHRRPELEGPAPDDPHAPAASWPDSPARDLVLRLAGAEPLREILRLRQQRVERRVTVDGQRVAILSLDRVDVEQDGRPLGEMRIVELELEAGIDPAASHEVMEALLERDGLRPEPASKLERAQEMARGASEAAG
jgi:inorganic triphosphatase YgiF